ncbi:MAG: hypothetical protein NTY09_02195 [bacterium]|nr:hypothetical protein [bacterium]
MAQSCNKIIILILTLLIALTLSCVNKNNPRVNDQNPAANNADSQTAETVTEPVPLELPFDMTVDGVSVSENSEVVIHSEEPVQIQVVSSVPTDSELTVLHPDGSSIPLGTWTTDVASFLHAFPYGENHLLVKWGDSVYDILVVSAAPEQSNSAAGCSSPFIDLNSDTVWRYKQLFNGTIETFWVYQVESWTESDDGTVSFSIETGMEGGVERTFIPQTTIDLYCSDNILYITKAVEIDGDATWTTTYDDPTIYIPAELTTGSTWERHGQMLVENPEGNVNIDLVERMRCTAEEQIAVEAGEFNAYKIEYSIERRNRSEDITDGPSTMASKDDPDLSIERRNRSEEIIDSGTSWYVPGLGRVLSISEDDSKRLELVSYTGTNPRLQQM